MSFYIFVSIQIMVPIFFPVLGSFKIQTWEKNLSHCSHLRCNNITAVSTCNPRLRITRVVSQGSVLFSLLYVRTHWKYSDLLTFCTFYCAINVFKNIFGHHSTQNVPQLQSENIFLMLQNNKKIWNWKLGPFVLSKTEKCENLKKLKYLPYLGITPRVLLLEYWSIWRTPKT